MCARKSPHFRAGFTRFFDRQTVGSILRCSLLSSYSSLNSQKNSLMTNEKVLIDLDSVRTEMNTILIPGKGFHGGIHTIKSKEIP